MARDGEDVEVYVSRGTETEVRAYEGEVESLSSATSAGAGIRVVRSSRQGFAYAGSLDEEVLAETLAEARDNATFASAEAWVGLPRPDGACPVGLDLWRDELAAYPNAGKVKAALDLERAVRAADPRIRQVESADWGDACLEKALASSLGVQASDRSTACYLSAVAVAGEGPRARSPPASASAVLLLTSTRPRQPATPSPGPSACWERPSPGPHICPSSSSPG